MATWDWKSMGGGGREGSKQDSQGGGNQEKLEFQKCLQHCTIFLQTEDAHRDGNQNGRGENQEYKVRN